MIKGEARGAELSMLRGVGGGGGLGGGGGGGRGEGCVSEWESESFSLEE
jgi:hypothetical protein